MQENKDEALVAGNVGNDSTTIHDAQRPKIDFAKRPIPDGVQFFQFPTRIGNTLAGYSDWMPEKGETPLGSRLSMAFSKTFGGLGRFLRRYGLPVMVKDLIYGLGIGWFLLFFIKVTSWYVSGLILLLPVVLLMAYSFIRAKPKFHNYYICTEGFAIYECLAANMTVDVAKEVRWDELSGLHVYSSEIYQSGEYQGTRHQYTWYGSSTPGEIYSLKLIQRRGQDGLNTPASLMHVQVCEVQWTQLLLRQLDHKLADVGYESFDYAPTYSQAGAPRIQLYRDKIIMRGKDEEHTYHFDDVARLYWQATPGKPQKKIDKVAFFVERAEAGGVSVKLLCNSSYFLAALGKVLEAKSWELPA